VDSSLSQRVLRANQSDGLNERFERLRDVVTADDARPTSDTSDTSDIEYSGRVTRGKPDGVNRFRLSLCHGW